MVLKGKKLIFNFASYSKISDRKKYGSYFSGLSVMTQSKFWFVFQEK